MFLNMHVVRMSKPASIRHGMMAFGTCFPFDTTDIGAGDAIGVSSCEASNDDEVNADDGGEENESMDCKVEGK